MPRHGAPEKFCDNGPGLMLFNPVFPKRMGPVSYLLQKECGMDTLWESPLRRRAVVRWGFHSGGALAGSREVGFW